MEVVTQARDLHAVRARLRAPIGVVPTMGALHAGHASLIERARRECAALVVTVFVNPLQFGPNEDFNAYPRSLDDDRAMAESLGVDVLFAPTIGEMYPQKLEVFVEPTLLAQHLEGERRPGHFRGVATIVMKLIHLIAPQKIYFGQKDAQQLAVVRRMVTDLNVGVDVVACDTAREPDGLALSSRNAYLTAAQRRAAPNLHRALHAVHDRIAAGEGDVAHLLDEGRRALEPLREDYLAVVRPDEFRPLHDLPAATDLLVVGAAFAGRTRLIDNLKVHSPARPEGNADGG